MTIPSLLDDYRKYLDIEKDLTNDYVDLSNIRFVSPASFLPAYNFAQNNSIPKFSCHDHAYEHILKILGRYECNSNLLPLVPINIGKYDTDTKNKVLTDLDVKIRKLLFPNNTKGHEEYGGVDTFPYITGEILSNVGEHSEANMVYSYSQIYPNEGYIDVGILDDGISIPGKYEESRPEFVNKEINPYEFKDDCDAIYRSLNGISTKHAFKMSMDGLLSEEDIAKNDNIGYGINTSFRMITEGLGGSFLIVSRNGICHLTPNGKKKFIKLNNNNNIINGTLICIRFNKVKLEHEEFVEYYEQNVPISNEDVIWEV